MLLLRICSSRLLVMASLRRFSLCAGMSLPGNIRRCSSVPFRLQGSDCKINGIRRQHSVVPSHFSSVAEVSGWLKGKTEAEALCDLKELIRTCQYGRQYSGLSCPKCEGGDSREMSFSLHIDEQGTSVVWNCFRAKCGWQGRSRLLNGQLLNGLDAVNAPCTSKHEEVFEKQLCKELNGLNGISPGNVPSAFLTEKSLGLEPLCEQIIHYFRERHISEQTLSRNGVSQLVTSDEPVIAFPYRRDGIIVNCKYRDVDKNFWQEIKDEYTFYGLDDIKDTNEIIIVEGEIDKLSFEEAGYKNCVSVPYGLSFKEKRKDFDYLVNCWKYFDMAKRIILAVDADEDGQILARELAERIGYERCHQVIWPFKLHGEYYNDANEVLRVFGPEFLRNCIAKAEPFPMKGLIRFQSFFSDIRSYYTNKLGFEMGVSTGWPQLDDYYKVFPGEVTIVSGVPNSGKSEWIDALMCNLNKSVGWTFVIASMENQVKDHGRKLLEKCYRKPFFDTGYGKSCSRLTPEEYEEGKDWLKKTFFLIRSDPDPVKMSTVLDCAKASVLRDGARGLLIDPYNELDCDDHSLSESESVSKLLTKLRCFAHRYNCHVWFVAHPRQLTNWNGRPPNIYDISGSSHFINKCDNCIVIHREREYVGSGNRVEVNVLKVRNKLAGVIGKAYLLYNRVTGEYE